MLGRNHCWCSAFLGTIGFAAVGVSPVGYAVGMTGVVLGSIMPDIDTPNSIISRRLPVKLYEVLDHRGITHSLWGLLIWALAMHWLLEFFGSFWYPYSPLFWLWIGCVAGYFFHLLEDSWSIAGIRWFAPLSPCDQYVAQHNHQLVREVHHFVEENGRNIPCRHFWGRGYVVGSSAESVIVNCFGLIACICLMHLFLIWI